MTRASSNGNLKASPQSSTWDNRQCGCTATGDAKRIKSMQATAVRTTQAGKNPTKNQKEIQHVSVWCAASQMAFLVSLILWRTENHNFVIQHIPNPNPPGHSRSLYMCIPFNPLYVRTVLLQCPSRHCPALRMQDSCPQQMHRHRGSGFPDGSSYCLPQPRPVHRACHANCKKNLSFLSRTPFPPASS